MPERLYAPHAAIRCSGAHFGNGRINPASCYLRCPVNRKALLLAVQFPNEGYWDSNYCNPYRLGLASTGIARGNRARLAAMRAGEARQQVQDGSLPVLGVHEKGPHGAVRSRHPAATPASPNSCSTGQFRTAASSARRASGFVATGCVTCSSSGTSLIESL